MKFLRKNSTIQEPELILRRLQTTKNWCTAFKTRMDIVDRSYREEYCGQMLRGRILWTNVTGKNIVDRCYGEEYCGQMLQGRILWTDVTGKNIVDRCYREEYCGQMLQGRIFCLNNL